MPRKARIDAAGALHHIICRGIEGRDIFKDNIDRDNFVDRLGKILSETKTPCFAWALIPNHFHLLWQDVDYVLSFFGKRVSSSRKQYRIFVEKGVEQGRRPDLTGGGLVRSSGGWAALKSLRRMQIHLKGDERILGDSDFVESALKAANENMERRYRLKAIGYDFDKVVQRVAELFQMKSAEILLPSKQPDRVKARSLVCFWAVKELSISSLSVASKLRITQPAVSRAAQRGEKLAIENNLCLEKELNVNCMTVPIF